MATTTKIKRCASQHFGPWAIDPKWMEDALAAVNAGTWKAGFFDDDEDDGDDDEPSYDIQNGIAIIRMQGQITKGRSSFGGCSSVETRKAVRGAVADWQVRAIMLYVDSPGGTIAGTADLAEDIRNASAEKPVWGYAADLACSAAYWCISQCERIYANSTAIVGNIGTYVVLRDTTGAQDLNGVAYKVVSTGKYKGLGSDGKVTDDLVSDVQREVNDLNAPFLADVMTGREKSQEWMDSMSDGRAHIGVQAKQLGLIAEVASFDAAMKALSEEIQMSSNPLEAFKAQHPDAFKAIRDEGYAEGHKAGKLDGYADGMKDAGDRAKALKEAFPGREGFALEQFCLGRDVAGAKGAFSDVLLKENEELRKQNATKKPEQQEQTGVPFTTEQTQGGQMSATREEQLLAMTPAGRAILAERRANKK